MNDNFAALVQLGVRKALGDELRLQIESLAPLLHLLGPRSPNDRLGAGIVEVVEVGFTGRRLQGCGASPH